MTTNEMHRGLMLSEIGRRVRPRETCARERENEANKCV